MYITYNMVVKNRPEPSNQSFGGRDVAPKGYIAKFGFFVATFLLCIRQFNFVFNLTSAIDIFNSMLTQFFYSSLIKIDGKGSIIRL